MKSLMHMLAAMAPLLFVPQQVEAASAIKTVIVIAMENTDADQIYDNTNTALAPYIHGTLMPIAARASNFNDPLPVKTRSEPHYIWMEAGTNSFSDHIFTDDEDPVPRKVKNSTKKGKNSAKKVKNSTASKDHLVTQLDQAGLTWMSYQEDMTAGQCPIESVGRYAAKHNPFVFFEDVSGKPPGTNNEFCIKHHKPYKDFFAADLAANNLANYVFITPNLCNDMHQSCKQNVHRITAGNNWLEAELPRIIDWVTKNAGVIFIIWDEGDKTQKLPFLAIGPGVNPNHVSAVPFNHGSLVRSVEEIFSLPILPKVSKNKTFTDLFKPGSFP